MNELKAFVKGFLFGFAIIIFVTGIVYLATKDYPAKQGAHPKAEHEEVQSVH